MERTIVAALADEGIEAGGARRAHRRLGRRSGKIGSIGVHVSSGVTRHGFAVNVDNDLQPFEWIVPCGMEGVRMTLASTRRPAGRAGMDCFRDAVASASARRSTASASGVAELSDCADRSAEHGSRANPGGARVLQMGEVLPFRERKPRVVQGAGARRRRATAS